MWLNSHQKARKILTGILVLIMAILLLVYPLETQAKRPLVRIQHSGAQGHVSSSAITRSYDQSREARAQRDARENVSRAQDSLREARSRAARVQSQGPSSQSPNSHYRDMMESQGSVLDAQSNLREQQSREYWERRR
jgi:hypothetical protein